MIILSVIFSDRPLLPIVVLLFCLLVTIAVGVPAKIFILRLLAPMSIATVLFVLQAFLAGSTEIWGISLWGLKLSMSNEGLHSGIQMSVRILGAVSVMLLLSSVTPAHKIFVGLRALGAPGGWVEIALLMYRYIFVLFDLASDLTSAQRLRLGYSNFKRGMSAAGVVAGTVILRSVDQSIRTDEAMRVRGYRGEIPIGKLSKLPLNEWGIMVAASIMIILLYWWAFKVRFP